MLIIRFNNFIIQLDTKPNIVKASYKERVVSTANTVLLPTQTKKSK
jgi:hypothetical protein